MLVNRSIVNFKSSATKIWVIGTTIYTSASEYYNWIVEAQSFI